MESKPLLPSSVTIIRQTEKDHITQLYKYGAIILLTIQQASMPLMVRSARDREVKDVFITTVNVFFMDIIKLFVCFFVLTFNERSLSRFFANCRRAIFGDLLETAKICVPSMIYNFQNNLYYIALSNLESTTFCVLYQMKILTTALMLFFLLKKPLSKMQWFALVILIAGVANVQLQYEPPKESARVGTQQNAMLGFITVLIMCFTSAFAGVYMEKILKQSSVDVWMQNIRLALFGLLVSTITMYFKDVKTIQKYGFFVGFDRLVWLMTFTNSAGGLLISVVIKYADNISKAYAQSMAIVGAAIGSWFLFDFVPNLMFLTGTLFVIVSIYIYTAHPYKA